MKRFLFLPFFFFSCLYLQAQDAAIFLKKQLISGADTLPYRVLLPKDYNPKRAYPLFLFLHGAGERGNDNEKQLVHIAPIFLKDSIRDRFPAIVVFPQCSADSYWSNMRSGYDSVAGKRVFVFNQDTEPTRAMALLLKLYQRLGKDYKTDSRRRYVGGLSMGGMGTFELVRRLPGAFASAVAICGGADPASAKALKATAWWIFHGMDDRVVDPQFSIDMANALKVAGTEVRLTLYPGVDHNSWDPAFGEAELLPWIFDHSLRK